MPRAFKLIGEKEYDETVRKVEDYITAKAGVLPARRAAAIRARYGKDHTFSVPILMTCAHRANGQVGRSAATAV